ncbi:MAG: hypothetical protein H5T78_17395 [Nocardia sp.]|nr:hypothetical protein [Nocardia sp.]
MDRVKRYWRPVALGVGLISAGAGLFVVAAAKKWAAPSTIWAGLGSAATLATAAIAIGTLLALKQDSRDRSRPMMMAQLQPAVLNVEHSELRVTNAGPSVAKNVRAEFDPALPVLDEATHADRNAFYLQRRYSKVIPTITPGMVLWNLYRKAEEPEEPLPSSFGITFTYEDMHGRTYVDRYDLTLETLMDETNVRPATKGEEAERRRAVKALESIARAIGRP